MAGGDLAGGKTLRAATGAFICFDDEAGVTGRPPKGRTGVEFPNSDGHSELVQR